MLRASVPTLRFMALWQSVRVPQLRKPLVLAWQAFLRCLSLATRFRCTRFQMSSPFRRWIYRFPH
jgi:hypothetical protein